MKAASVSRISSKETSSFGSLGKLFSSNKHGCLESVLGSLREHSRFPSIKQSKADPLGRTDKKPQHQAAKQHPFGAGDKFQSDPRALLHRFDTP
jgi:hypothetical protein